jgi:hypothetical protein
MRALSVGALIALLTIMLVAGLSEAQSTDSAGSSEIELTAAERAAFVKGAKEVGGLSEDQIALALRDPKLLAATPVGVRSSSRIIDASPADSDRAVLGEKQTRAYAPVCRKKQFTNEIVNEQGEAFLKFIVTKSWCFDGEKVLSGSMNEVSTWVRPDLRGGPDTPGWVYNKSVERGTEGFLNYEGRYHGAHKSTRAGKFEYWRPGDKYPWGIIKTGVVQIGRYNGTCDSTNYVPPPDPKIDSGPAGSTRSSTARFTFSSRTPGATSFRCSIDGAGFASCVSPKSYSGLGEGAHSFRVEAVNPSGNANTLPPARVWKVDTTAPQVVNIVPRAGAVGVTTMPDVKAVFSETMKADTINEDTFTLVKKGTTVPVSAAVGYDPTVKTATLYLYGDLAAGTTYTAKIRGGSTGIKDSAGNPLAADRVWSFTVAN